MENLEKENMMLKIALCKMIRQFMFCRTINGIEYFDDLCESAGEWAFKTLGFKEDFVKVEEIERLEEQEGDKLLALNKSER